MDETTGALLKVLRAHFEKSKVLGDAWQGAPALTLMHLTRPGWPGENLKPLQKQALLKELIPIASQLAYANDMKSLLNFAQQAIAKVMIRLPNHSKTVLEQRHLAGLIQAERALGEDDQAAASRAAAKYFQTKRREHRGKTYIPADPNNRLAQILSLPKSIGAELPKQDIRGLIMKSPLADLLKQAACFAPEVLKPVLGEELFSKIKPVGFGDKQQRTILIQVESASVAHEMSFRKLDILGRLKRIKEFEQVSDLRFIS